MTTDPNALEAQAKKFMDVRSYNYVAGGAGEKATMDANRLAFRQWKVNSLSTPSFPAPMLSLGIDDSSYAPSNHAP